MIATAAPAAAKTKALPARSLGRRNRLSSADRTNSELQADCSSGPNQKMTTSVSALAGAWRRRSGPSVRWHLHSRGLQQGRFGSEKVSTVKTTMLR